MTDESVASPSADLAPPQEPSDSAARGGYQPIDARAAGQESHIDTHARQRVLGGQARRPLVEWSVYLLVMLAGVLLLAGPFIQDAIASDRSRISLVILALFAGALVKNFLDIRFIAKQKRLADGQIEALRQSNNIYLFLKNAEPSLLRDHIHNLHEVYRRDVQISQDNLITLMQTRLLSRTRVVDFTSSVLVTLGLVGTIIGLIAATGGLTTVVNEAAEPGQSSTLLSGMRATMAGMGVAFYTTLMGAILGGVCLRLLASLVDAHIDHMVSHIAELTEVYILPVLRRAARIAEQQHHHQRQQALLRGESLTMESNTNTTEPAPASGSTTRSASTPASSATVQTPS